MVLADPLQRPKAASLGRAFALTGSFVLAVVLILGTSAAPVEARTCGPITINEGSVTPGTGSTGTTFTFSVHFRDTTGSAPTSVEVRVNGVWSAMAPQGTAY